MRKKVSLILIISVILLFFLPFIISAEESNLLNPEIKKEIQEMVEQAKKTEKAGLRPEKELRDEIALGSIFNAILFSSGKLITEHINKPDRDEAINFAEDSIVVMIKTFEEKAPVPVVEKTLAYLVLINIANFKNDKKKASEYAEKAIDNLLKGINYYQKIKESPFAQYNLLYFYAIASQYSLLKNTPISDNDIKKWVKSLQAYPIIKRRMNNINQNIVIWDNLSLKMKSK